MRKFICFISVLFLLICSASAFANSWEPSSDEYWIRVSKPTLKLSLYKGQTLLKSWPVAIGRGRGKVKHSRRDFITPAGKYEIWRVVQNARNLVWDPGIFNEPGRPRKGVYGAKLISFRNNWKIAIHGTSNPESIGRRITHGCIRMRNRDIIELCKYVRPPMTLIISD